MAVKIAQASQDENYRYSGGKAGDQTGKEVFITNWYKYGWKMLLRHPDYKIGIKAATIAEQLAKSNLVGYDQTIAASDGRNILYKELKKNGWSVDKYIASGVKTECDCSSFVYAVYCCIIPELRADGNVCNTRNLESVFTKVGFKKETADLYLNTSDYLKTGDILNVPGSHVIMVVGGTATKTESDKVKYYPKYTGSSKSIAPALYEVGEKNVSLAHRKKIAVASKLCKTEDEWTGSVAQNTKMLTTLRSGKLVRVE